MVWMMVVLLARGLGGAPGVAAEPVPFAGKDVCASALLSIANNTARGDGPYALRADDRAGIVYVTGRSGAFGYCIRSAGPIPKY